MSVATTLSRITGFVRMWAMAAALGASGVTAAYNIANNIPNMIFELVAGGILSSLFIPTYLQVKVERGNTEAHRFASHVLTLSVLALGLIAVIGTVLPGPFIWTQTFRDAGEGSAAVRATAAFLFRFFAVQIAVYGAGMVVQGILNAERRYLWTALGPVFNNLVVIATMLIVAARPLTDASLVVLAIGTTLGVVTMFAVMVPSLLRTDFRYRFDLGLDDPYVRRMLALAVPTVVYVATNLVAVSFRNASALAVSDNGPAILAYAWTFYQLPYGILAVALATAVFTELSEAAGRSDLEAYRRTFSRGLRATVALILPASALIVALAEPLATLYLIGRFSERDIVPVATALRVWAAGLVFFACMMYTLRAFYSLKDTRTPMLVNLATTVVQIAGYLVLTSGIGAWSGLGVNGVPLTDGLFSALQFSVLIAVLRPRVGGLGLRRLLAGSPGLVASSAAAALAAAGVDALIAPTMAGFAGALLRCALGGAAGLATAYLAASLLGLEEALAVERAVTGVLDRVRRARRRISR